MQASVPCCLILGFTLLSLGGCTGKPNPNEAVATPPSGEVDAPQLMFDLASNGSVPIRVEDPVASHCIDASKEAVTIHVRRLFLRKYKGFFTEDKRAGVVVRARLSGKSINSDPIDVTIPSMNAVAIDKEVEGQVSVPLEYEIAQYLALKHPKGTYYGINLAVDLAKTRDKTSFGKVLDLAGKALGKVKIPAVPYLDLASQFLKFANDAVEVEVAAGTGAVPFANLSLAFNAQAEADLAKCKAAGKERTGGFGVLLSTGTSGNLLPVQDTDKLYCLSYTSGATYEVTAAKRKADGTCPAASEYKAITNDNVFFLLSAAPPVNLKSASSPALLESRRRCEHYKLPLSACGVAP